MPNTDISETSITQPVYNLDDFPAELNRFNHGAFNFPIYFCREMNIPLEIYRKYKFFNDFDFITEIEIDKGKIDDKELSTFEFGLIANKIACQYRMDPDILSIKHKLNHWNNTGIKINIAKYILIMILPCVILYFYYLYLLRL